MKLQSLGPVAEPPVPGNGPRQITLRNFVLTAVAAAAACLVWRRTGDTLVSTATVPLTYRFLAHWIRG